MYYFSNKSIFSNQSNSSNSDVGLRIEDKPVLNVIDIFHSYKYSEKHFKERTELYKKFYGKELNKDYKVKCVNV
jgi:hypothetical protein